MSHQKMHAPGWTGTVRPDAALQRLAL